MPINGISWDGRGDPYKIWISEIIPSRHVSIRVIPYYERFLGLVSDHCDQLSSWRKLLKFGRLGLLSGPQCRKLPGKIMEDHGGVSIKPWGYLWNSTIQLEAAGCQYCFWLARASSGWQCHAGFSSFVWGWLRYRSLTNRKIFQAMMEVLDPERPGDFNQGLWWIWARDIESPVNPREARRVSCKRV